MIDLAEEVKTLCCLAVDDGWALRDFLLAIEKSFIVRELERFNGNQTRAAVALGVHRNTLTRNMKLLGIPSTPNGRRWVKRQEAQRAEAESFTA